MIDTVAPLVSLTSPSDGTLTNDPTLSFSGTAGTAPGDDAEVRIEVLDARRAVVETVSAQRNATTGAYAAAISSPLADGAYTAVAKQSDDVGNRGSSSSIGFRVDAHGPVPSLSTQPEARTRVATPTFAGTAGTEAGDTPAVSVRIHAGTAASGTPVATLESTVDGSGHFQVVAGRLADGTYTAAVTQTDGAGNLGSSPPATFTVDTTAPALTLTTPSPGGRAAPKPEFAGIGGIAFGDSATVTITVHAGSAATGPLVQTLVATRDPQSGAYRATSPFDLATGTYTAVVAQADDVGNEAATAARTFSVDTTAADRPADDRPAGERPAVDRPAADRTKPVLSRVSLSPARFKVGTAKTALTASAAKALKRGTSVRYTLSESATVTLAIARSGQRKTVGTITPRSKKGANRIAFSGRLGSKALKPGRYVLTLSAVDAAGNRGAAKQVSFRIG
ncbi:Ig-like domain-containing protein [Conexibacter stalactiti]|uniref:Ig-like domain-containing protein n=1 Tax=Conexibacter stalactiti TaxID=1940611 RepID=A0ABU4HML1_9ACTN|nr:Ig-like domain-containing protein [Conexibacter stalactiti]MDW5594492.1 Ig-like domain-containing protein [Conexibacter stalactiti]MEC5035134.1 Ig-like domain-containing protein [Conexibacter stalactiti]